MFRYYGGTLYNLSIRFGEILPRWRNWYTRTIEVRMSQDVEVQILSWAQEKIAKAVFFVPRAKQSFAERT